MTLAERINNFFGGRPKKRERTVEEFNSPSEGNAPNVFKLREADPEFKARLRRAVAGKEQKRWYHRLLSIHVIISISMAGWVFLVGCVALYRATEECKTTQAGLVTQLQSTAASSTTEAALALSRDLTMANACVKQLQRTCNGTVACFTSPTLDSLRDAGLSQLNQMPSVDLFAAAATATQGMVVALSDGGAWPRGSWVVSSMIQDMVATVPNVTAMQRATSSDQFFEVVANGVATSVPVKVTPMYDLSLANWYTVGAQTPAGQQSFVVRGGDGLLGRTGDTLVMSTGPSGTVGVLSFGRSLGAWSQQLVYSVRTPMPPTEISNGVLILNNTKGNCTVIAAAWSSANSTYWSDSQACSAAQQVNGQGKANVEVDGVGTMVYIVAVSTLTLPSSSLGVATGPPTSNPQTWTVVSAWGPIQNECPGMGGSAYIPVWALMVVGTLFGLLLAFVITYPIDNIAERLNQVALMDLQNVRFDKFSNLWEVRKMQYNFKHLVNNLKLYNAIRVSIIVLDENMSVTFANPFFFFSFNIENHAKADEWIAHLLETDREFADNLMAMSTAYYESIIKEVQYEGPDGTPVHLKIHGRINDAHSIILAIENITEQLRYEETLQDAIQQAENANKAKSQFLSHMTHELRTPLNGVIGMSSLIADMDLTGEQLALVESIKFSADLLLSLISDILDLSKIEAGAVDLIELPLDILLLCENIMVSTSQSIKKEIELLAFVDPRIPNCLRGDPRRISQILNNLLSNACKFTDDGYVYLAIEYRGYENGCVKLFVKCEDTGIGVKKENQDKLFEAFYQVNPNGPNGGTGLGLSITAALVKMMNSSGLQLKSEWGRGSTFYFDIALQVDTSGANGGKSYKELAHEQLGIRNWSTSREFPLYTTPKEDDVPSIADTRRGSVADSDKKGSNDEIKRLNSGTSFRRKHSSGQDLNVRRKATSLARTSTSGVTEHHSLNSKTRSDLSRTHLPDAPKDPSVSVTSITLHMPFTDMATDKGCQTDMQRDPRLVNCMVLIKNSAIRETVVKYLPDGWVGLEQPVLDTALDMLYERELAISRFFDDEKNKDFMDLPEDPYHCVILDSQLLFNKYEKRPKEFNTNPTATRGRAVLSEEERADKEVTEIARISALKQKMRALGALCRKNMPYKERAMEEWARTSGKREGPKCSTIAFIVLVNRRRMPEQGEWFDNSFRVSVLPKPTRYMQLVSCLAFAYQYINDAQALLGPEIIAPTEPTDAVAVKSQSVNKGKVPAGRTVTLMSPKREGGGGTAYVDMSPFATTSIMDQDKVGKNSAMPSDVAIPSPNTPPASAAPTVGVGVSTNEVLFPLGLSILLVEDNLINIKVATSMLKGAQLDFDVAQNGKEAVDKVVEGSKWHDIILMDVQMPIMDGLQATAEIRKHERKLKARGAPNEARRHIIIAMTADVMATTVEQCFKTGMDDYFPKPIRKQEFYRVLSQWARKACENNPALRYPNPREVPVAVVLADDVEATGALNRRTSLRKRSEGPPDPDPIAALVGSDLAFIASPISARAPILPPSTPISQSNLSITPQPRQSSPVVLSSPAVITGSLSVPQQTEKRTTVASLETPNENETGAAGSENTETKDSGLASDAPSEEKCEKAEEEKPKGERVRKRELGARRGGTDRLAEAKARREARAASRAANAAAAEKETENPGQIPENPTSTPTADPLNSKVQKPDLPVAAPPPTTLPQLHETKDTNPLAPTQTPLEPTVKPPPPPQPTTTVTTTTTTTTQTEEQGGADGENDDVDGGGVGKSASKTRTRARQARAPRTRTKHVASGGSGDANGEQDGQNDAPANKNAQNGDNVNQIGLKEAATESLLVESSSLEMDAGSSVNLLVNGDVALRKK